MDNQSIFAPPPQKNTSVKIFLLHLAIFVVVNLLILVVPGFYAKQVDFSFEDRGPMLYGSIRIAPKPEAEET